MKFSLRNLLYFVMAIVLAKNGCFAAPAIRAANETVMENEQVLDEFGKFILRWTVLNETSEIEMEAQVNCTGWLGIGFLPAVWGYPGAVGDAFIAGYNDKLDMGYIEDRWANLTTVPEPGGGEIDEHADFILKSAAYHEPWTIIRISRKIDTGDYQDIPIVPGPMEVYYTYSAFDNTGIPHAPGTPGQAFVTFY